MMNKLLVNTVAGTQEIIFVGEGGGYFDPSRVLWDERVDGAMPDVTLGGMVRVGNALQIDNALLSASLEANQLSAAIQAREVAKHARTTKIAALTVTITSGKVFDANEAALARLTQAHVVGTANNMTSTMWTLADNTRVTVTLAEITEAMTLAGLAQNAIWVI